MKTNKQVRFVAVIPVRVEIDSQGTAPDWSKVTHNDIRLALATKAANASRDELVSMRFHATDVETVAAPPQEECANVRDLRQPDPFRIPASVLMPAQVDDGEPKIEASHG